MKKPYYLNRLSLCLVTFLLATVSLVLTTQLANAQSIIDGDWSTPVNLSHSGSTNSPLMVVDSNGIFNIIWQDSLLRDVVYAARGNGKSWDAPKAVTLPFGVAKPVLLADTKGSINAFWINPGSFDGNVYYSKVNSADFNKEGWSAPQTIITSTTTFDVLIDQQGNFHLVYIQSSPDLPAGIYYTHSTDIEHWSTAKPLLQAAYFRALTPANSHIQITSSIGKNGLQALYVVWDNQVARRVSFAASFDNGQSWGTPMDIDTPNPSAPNTWPYNIQINAIQDKVVLTWQYSQIDGNCVVYSDWSVDRGVSWRGKERIIDKPGTCPHINQLLNDGKSLVLLLGTLEDQTIFLSWDASQWSPIQEQTALDNLIDPETFSPVDLGCQQAVLTRDDILYLISCDSTENGDIWITSRTIGSFAESSISTKLWSPPLLISNQNALISSLNLLTANDNVLHVFWSQPDESSTIQPVTAIYHASFHPSNGWSHPLAILQSPINGAKNPKAVYSPKGNMVVFWNGGESGQIYYSWVSANQADSPLEWQAPVELQVLQGRGASFDVNMDETGKIRVLYAIPFNEQRGVYLTETADDGKNWSNPIQIFDGVAANWDMVTQPLLLRLPDGRLQAMWAKYTIPGGRGSLSIYSSNSIDNGASWSSPKEETDRPITWASLLNAGPDTIHRLLLETGGQQTTLWHDISPDGGITWNKQSFFLGSQDAPGPVGVAADKTGQVHLFQLTDGGNIIIIQHWRWDGVRWLSDAKLKYSKEKTSAIEAVAVSISDTGEIFVIYVTSIENPATEKPQSSLFFIQHTLNLPILPTPIPTPTPQGVMNTPTATPVTSPPTPTPTIDLAKIPLTAGSGTNNSMLFGVGFGGVLAIIVIIIGIGATKLRR